MGKTIGWLRLVISETIREEAGLNDGPRSAQLESSLVIKPVENLTPLRETIAGLEERKEA